MRVIYTNIKNRRKELGLSQEELARLIGYTDRSSISKIEKGKVDLSIDTINAFAKALDIEPSVLMGWDDEPITIDFSQPEHKTNLISDDNEYIQMYMELNQEDKDMVNKMIKTLYSARSEQ